MNVFLGESEMSESFQTIIEKLSENYSVQSLIPNTATFIFILESPHVQELKHQAPIAGSSGKTMTTKLLGETYNQPLGLLIKQNLEVRNYETLLNKIGVMNVSNIPLQRKAYNDEQLVHRYESFFTLLEKIRTTNEKTTYASEQLNELQCILLSRFNSELEKLLDRKCTIIPCGRFAQKFLKLSTVRGEDWTIIHDIPHPSYNSWNQAKYKQKIDELLQAFIYR